MREVLFRGISRDTQTFVFGDLLQWKDGDCDICVNDLDTNGKNKFPVYPETVGQFTGLTDKNGKKIFEGDILNVYTALGSRDLRYAVVSWNNLFNCWHVGNQTIYGGNVGDIYEVIGNIHENPELLKEGAQV